MDNQTYDLAIIGGGINGAGIARDAAGRGLSVILIEKGDLASATSSSSSKLVHGGLRYLEYGEFRLVRESLRERERLLAIAPHLVRPMTFLLPVPAEGGARPNWMVRVGLKLYDVLAGAHSTLPRSGSVRLHAQEKLAEGLNANIRHGFTYSDCWVDDARLVVMNALDAKERGAIVRTRTECTAIKRSGAGWALTLMGGGGGAVQNIQARAVVNAAGPWANEVVKLAGATTKGRIKRVQGSHIVVPRVHEGNHACLLQMPDKRVVFLLPFEQDFTLIGTTDQSFEGDAGQVAIRATETRYLLDGANRFLQKPLSEADVIWNYSGVRALYDDQSSNLSAMTRDYVLEFAEGDAPFLSVFGGKITTYRCLAEAAMEKLAPFFPQLTNTASWTGETPLPGGDARPEIVLASLKERYGSAPQQLFWRWVRLYGTRAPTMLEYGGGMGEQIAPDVFECELLYARDIEWAMNAVDFLWRRTKLGLHLNEADQEKLQSWFDRNPMPAA